MFCAKQHDKRDRILKMIRQNTNARTAIEAILSSAKNCQALKRKSQAKTEIKTKKSLLEL